MTETKIFRKCTKCGREATSIEALKNFVKHPTYTYKRANKCKSCHNLQMKEYYHKNIEESRDYYKKHQTNKKKERKELCINRLGGRCQHCGIVYDGTNAVIYDFHHLNPSEKEYEPCALLDKDINRLYTEIDKCILLCSNYHRLEHGRLR